MIGMSALSTHAFFFELQRRYHAVDQSRRHAIRQGMISRFLGIRPILVRIAQNIGRTRDHFHFDFLNIVSLESCVPSPFSSSR